MEGLSLLVHNSRWKVREGQVLLWFDKFMVQGPQCEEVENVEELNVKIWE